MPTVPLSQNNHSFFFKLKNCLIEVLLIYSIMHVLRVYRSSLWHGKLRIQHWYCCRLGLLLWCRFSPWLGNYHKTAPSKKELQKKKRVAGVQLWFTIFKHNTALTVIVKYWLYYVVTYILFIYFFDSCTCSVWKFLGQGLNQSCSGRPPPQPQQCEIQAVSVIYSASCGNT